MQEILQQLLPQSRREFEETLTGETGVKLLLSNSEAGDFVRGLVRLTVSYGDAAVQAKFSDEKIPDEDSLKAIGDKLIDVLEFIS